MVGEHMWLNRELVQADVIAFEKALERGNRETAAALYGGPFLDGFHLGGSQEFEDWLEAERARLAELHSKALESLARRAEGAGDLARAAEWWKQLLATDPYNSRITVRLMEALAAAGDPANALQQALAHERLLRDELDMEPAPEVRALVERLRAEPSLAERFEHAGTTAEAVGDSAPETPSPGVVSEVAQRSRRPNRLAVGLVAVAVTATLASVWVWWRSVARDIDRPVVEFYLDPPDAAMSFGARLLLSPDGRRLVAEIDSDDGRVLYQRMLDGRDWRVIPGTEGAYAPFFSPDGEWLGFVSGQDGSIKKIPVNGGSVHTIARVDVPVESASWGPDNTVVFSKPESASGDRTLWLYRVAADGGMPERLTTPDPALLEGSPREPHYLPRGDVVLFTAVNNLLKPTVAALSLESGTVLRLGPGMTPLSDRLGRILYVTPDGSAVVQEFNPGTLALEGSPRPIAERVAITAGFIASYTVSSDGPLAYLSELDQGDRLMLVSREGETRPLFSAGAGSSVGVPRFSPSGDRIAFVRDGDVWVYSFAQGTAQRLSFEGPAPDPAWTTDGRFIGYSVIEGDGSFASLYLRAADGTGSAKQILAGDRDFYQVDFAPGDSEVVFYSSNKVFRARLDSDSSPVALLETESFVEHPTLSPDGRWLAYKSDESGCSEVYVRSYPDMGPPTIVSTGGCGNAPAWSADGSEIFYWSGDRIMAASVRYDGSRVTVVERAELFSTEPFRWFFNRNYDVHPNGQAFVMVSRPKTRAVVKVNALAGEP